MIAVRHVIATKDNTSIYIFLKVVFCILLVEQSDPNTNSLAVLPYGFAVGVRL